MTRALIAAILAAVPLIAQGTKPKDSASEYPAHADLNGVTIAAENFGHSITSEKGAYFAREFIAIDVAVFSRDKTHLSFTAGQFTIRLNGKTVLLAQSPGSVSASLKYEDWNQRPRMMGGGGLGDGSVTLGGPRPAERFPGDPNGRPRLPNPPSTGTADPNVQQEQPAPVEEVIQRASMPEGSNLVAPFSGFVFFPYKGKLSKIKSLELLYEGPYGTASLRLP